MRVRSGVAIDLGTVNTLVYVLGRGVIIDEPTAIAVSRETGQVISVGSDADDLTGKEPQGVDVVHPLRDGVITDLDATVVMLQAFLRRAQLRRRAGKVPALVCVPAEATYVERRAVVAAAEAIRPRCAVQLIDEPVAAAAGSGLGLTAGSGAFVVDIGGGTTEVAVLAGSHVVRARSLRAGGNAMDDAITKAVRDEHDLLIGRNAARNLKMTLGLAAGPLTEAETVGVDAARRKPRVARISAALVSTAIEPTARAITGTVQEILADVPPNLAEEVVRSKIRLSGGGALVPGLAFRIETAADIAAMVVDDPLHCVIRGAAQILESGMVSEAQLTT
jgi:rod shape-determining protein MreB and related proteins